jgi:hypothetical protein
VLQGRRGGHEFRLQSLYLKREKQRERRQRRRGGGGGMGGGKRARALLGTTQ